MAAPPLSILFDLDGTVVDSKPGILASYNAALRSLGHRPDSLDIGNLIGPPLEEVLAASFSKRCRSLSASRLCQPSESKGQRRRVATGIGATALRSGPDDARPIAHCRASLKARRRGVTAVSVRRRFTASHFRFRVSATSGRLGMVRVLLQLKVNRLCLVVDGTAGFDPFE